MLQEVIGDIKSAIQSGRTDVMRSLIVAAEQYSKEEDAEKFSVNSVLNSNIAPEGTFLHLATTFNQCDIVRLLLAAGADPGIQNDGGRTSLDLIANGAMRAVYVEDLLKSAAIGNVGRVCQLLAAGMDVNAVDNPESGNTALHWACTFGTCDTVRCLLDRKADINVINSNGCTPLHDAILHEQIEIAEELLKRGANPHAKPLVGKYANISAMDLAASNTKIIAAIQKHVSVIGNHASYYAEESSGSQESTVDLFQEGNLELNLAHSFQDATLDDEVVVKKLQNNFSENIQLDDRLHLLWPQPQQITRLDGSGFDIPALIKIYLDVKNDRKRNLLRAVDIVDHHATQLNKLDVQNVIAPFYSHEQVSPSSVLCCVNENVFARGESYKIKIASKMIYITASDATGLHYALCTFVQLLRLYLDTKSVPTIQITDWPNMKYRGVSLNASKDADMTPTLDYLFEIAEVLSRAKINQIFVRSKFCSDLDWPSAYSKEELLKLCCYCSKLHVSLIPAVDVESFGLAADSLAPLRFLKDYLGCFPGSRFLLLGPNLSKTMMNRSFASTIADTCKSHTLLVTHTSNDGFESTFASDILQDHVVLWDYRSSKNSEDCEAVLNKMRKYGISCGISAEISFTKSLCTCLDILLRQILEEVQTVKQAGCAALSLVIGNWTGYACWSTTHVLPGFFIAAALGWNCDFSWESLSANLPRILDAHVFEDRSRLSGSLVWKLNKLESALVGATTTTTTPAAPEKSNVLFTKGSTPLHQLLTEPDDLRLEYFSVDTFQKAIRSIKQCQHDVAAFKRAGSSFKINVDEVQFLTDLILFACRLGKALVTVGQNPNDCTGFSVVNMGIANLHVTTQTDLANKLLGLIEAYEQIVFDKFRPPRSDKVVRTLNRLVERLISSTEIADV